MRSALLDHLADHFETDGFRRVGSNVLRAMLDPDTEARLCFHAAGSVEPFFGISVVLGPRFKSIERIVNEASRLAGTSAASIRTAAHFPTLWVPLSEIAPIKNYISIDAHDAIRVAIEEYAIPLIKNLATIPTAANYALSRRNFAFGPPAKRIPVLLYKAGRADDAEQYMLSAMQQTAGHWLPDYYKALRIVMNIDH